MQNLLIVRLVGVFGVFLDHNTWSWVSVWSFLLKRGCRELKKGGISFQGWGQLLGCPRKLVNA